MNKPINCAILAYLPPPHYGNAEVFRANVLKFKTEVPVVFYSDHPYPDVIPIINPEVAKDRLRNGKVNKFAVNNAIFFTGLKIAHSKGLTHFIYLEEDCRVGCDHWDGQMLKEFFAARPHRPIGGSVVCYNPCNAGREAYDVWTAFVEKNNTRKNHPIPTYGWQGAAEGNGSCVFVNGALGIYSVSYLMELFGFGNEVKNSVQTAGDSRPWDQESGFKMWERHGVDAYNQLVHLKCIYSSYGNILSTEEERMDMLRSGKCCGVHQIKSTATV